MRFAHLSDLHIGKRVNGFSMIEDQKYILNQMIDIIKKEQVDAVLLAGDIYDKTVPSAEAVQVLDDFLTRLAELNLSVFMISGNHDSAERLAFGARAFRKSNIYISDVYRGNISPITIKDSYGEVHIYLLPFLKPSYVRQALQNEEIVTYEDAVKVALKELKIQTEERNVLVAHQFVIGASRSESEEIAVGGLDQIPHDLFLDFDYTALGHIHGPQHIGKETIRYCGTPLKYSFSEATHKKSVTIVEMKEKGTVLLKTVPLVPLKDMRKIRGTFEEITKPSYYQMQNCNDYLQITLTDEEDILNGLESLRKIYPNIMKFEYDNKRTKEHRELLANLDIEEKTEMELFEEFYLLQNNQEMSVEQKEMIQSVFEQEKGDF